MSRPFSYNDENFTVIGNVLFVHAYTKPVKKNEKIVELPPKIYERLIQSTVQGFTQNSGPAIGGGGGIYYGILKRDGNKIYLSTNADIQYANYITAFLFLKDI